MTVDPAASHTGECAAMTIDAWTPRLLEVVRETRPLIARSFGTISQEAEPVEGDLDLLVVLHPAPSFGAALAAAARAVQSLARASFCGPVSPAFNLQTWFGPSGGSPALHLVLHADPSLLLRLESPAFLDSVLTPHELDAVTRARRPVESVTRHFDLLDKATHALVLLLNTDPSLRACAEEHAARVARYVRRWSPVTPSIAPPVQRQSLGDAVLFYSSFGGADPGMQ